MPPTTLEAQGRPDLKIGTNEASDFLRNYKLPTAGQTYATSGISVADTPAEAEITRLQAQNKANIGPVDENAIYQNKLNQFQSEIDATNKIYAQKLAETQTQGLGNLGSSRAIQARSGLLGSDYGASQTANVTTQNNQQEDLVRQEQSAKIGAILGMVRQGAAEEIAAKRAAQQSSLKDYMDYLGQASERKINKLNALVSQLTSQGIDIKTVDPSELARLSKESGLSVSEITAEYNKQKTAADLAQEERNAKLIKDQSFTLGEGQDYYTYDPVTKKNVLVASKGKTYAPSTTAAEYGGYNGVQNKAIDQINKAVSETPSYKRLTTMNTFAENIDAALSQSSGTGDIAAINQFQKVIDEGAVTRDQDIKLIQSSQSLAGQLQTKINRLSKGDQLAPAQREQIRQLTAQMLDNQKKALKKDSFIASQSTKATRYGIDPLDTVLSGLGGYEDSTTGGTLTTAPDGTEVIITD